MDTVILSLLVVVFLLLLNHIPPPTPNLTIHFISTAKLVTFTISPQSLLRSSGLSFGTYRRVSPSSAFMFAILLVERWTLYLSPSSCHSLVPSLTFLNSNSHPILNLYTFHFWLSHPSIMIGRFGTLGSLQCTLVTYLYSYSSTASSNQCLTLLHGRESKDRQPLIQ